MIIIDLNKLIEVTMLFHLGIAYNRYADVVSLYLNVSISGTSVQGRLTILVESVDLGTMFQNQLHHL
jgi:hypothetical protein